MPDVSSICAKRIRAGDRLLPCMGLFSIFLVGSHSYVTARYAERLVDAAEIVENEMQRRGFSNG